MITIQEWLVNLSNNCSVQHIDDIKSGTVVANVTDDIYLMTDVEVEEK